MPAGIDLSPHMLAVGSYLQRQRALQRQPGQAPERLRFVHGAGEDTRMPGQSFDLVSVMLVRRGGRGGRCGMRVCLRRAACLPPPRGRASCACPWAGRGVLGPTLKQALPQVVTQANVAGLLMTIPCAPPCVHASACPQVALLYALISLRPPSPCLPPRAVPAGLPRAACSRISRHLQRGVSTVASWRRDRCHGERAAAAPCPPNTWKHEPSCSWRLAAPQCPAQPAL